MKRLTLILNALLITGTISAQNFTYKSGVINVDGKDMAKVVKIKDKANFGLTSSYELDDLNGQKLIIATIATDYVPSRNDNSVFYYRFTFLTTNQVAIFNLSKLSAEKSFANLIGESSIVADGQLDAKKINELIALKSQDPIVAVEYHLVQRDKRFNVAIKDNLVDQGGVTIGKFTKLSDSPDLSVYEFSLPEGMVIAKVSFKGRNAFQFLISTNKDKRTMNYTIDIDKNFGAVMATSGDFNETSLRRIAKWLVNKEYL